MTILSGLMASVTAYAKMILALIAGLAQASLAVQLAAVAALSLVVIAVSFGLVKAYQYLYAPVTSPELARFAAGAPAVVLESQEAKRELVELEKVQQGAKKTMQQNNNQETQLGYHEARRAVLLFKCQHNLGNSGEQGLNKGLLAKTEALCAALKNAKKK